ncbi:MAG: DUF1853 family protein [Ectothiorhodospiraceae bacterium]|nr:DUF1853 family protein [Ectothiorhodospiraceae bacterium]
MKTYPFKNAVVRDLAWVMLSPGLMVSNRKQKRLVSDDDCQKYYEAQFNPLKRLDEDPSPLLEYLSPLKSHRLGFYFEALLAYWIEHLLPSALFKKNIAVFQKLDKTGRRTIGEFDFLFNLQGESLQGKREIRHWEATVKFYLLYENKMGKVQWIGPGGRDRLDIKLARLFEHQLKLANTVEGRGILKMLSEAHSPSPHMNNRFPTILSAAFIKGYLFYPAGEENEMNVEVNDHSWYPGLTLSPVHLKGWWIRHGEKKLLQRGEGIRWLLLPKLRWLSSAGITTQSHQSADELMDDTAMTRYCDHHFTNGHSSLLFAEMQRTGNGWVEMSRGFVLHHSWPEIIDSRR